MKDKTKLYGVGGWLVFFLISLAVINPILGLLMTHFNIFALEDKMPELINNTSWMYYKVFAWTTLFIAIALQWKISYDLKTKFIPSSVFNVKLLLIVMPIAIVLWETVITLLLFNSSAIEHAIIPLLKQLAVNFIWVMYFNVSVRVKNTYYPQTQNETINKIDSISIKQE